MGKVADNQRQSTSFLLLYALAWTGGSISYVPFLTILLPVKVTDLAGPQDLGWLAYIAFAGAVSASVANIGFGWLSDRTRNRRSWITAGLILSSVILITVSQARDFLSLLGMIVMWQLALNMMLGPLAAWAGDCVPDGQKGLLGGLLAIAPAVGALSGAVVTLPGLASADHRLWLVALMVIICVSPVLLVGAPRPLPKLFHRRDGEVADQAGPRHIVAKMWLARLLVQIAEAALFAYIYFWLRSLDPRISDNYAASIFGGVLVAAVPLALFVGRWADRSGRPILPLALGATFAASGLLVMALATSITLALAGYVLFGMAATVFLSLHSAQTLRVLPRPEHRGRDLGLFNLTNTLPSLIMPWLVLALVPVFGFSGFFWLLAILASAGALLLFSMLRPA